jgi:uncharacterized protein YndB with AHSA1/START domain
MQTNPGPRSGLGDGHPNHTREVTMTKVSLTTKLAVPADQVWKVIGGFNALPEWLPPVKASKLDAGGRVRKLDLAGGGSVTEKLETFDDKKHAYSYSITNSPLPVANYVATIKVSEDGDGSTIEWSSEFSPSGASETEARKVIEGIYQSGFENLKKMFGA